MRISIEADTGGGGRVVIEALSDELEALKNLLEEADSSPGGASNGEIGGTGFSITLVPIDVLDVDVLCAVELQRWDGKLSTDDARKFVRDNWETIRREAIGMDTTHPEAAKAVYIRVTSSKGT